MKSISLFYGKYSSPLGPLYVALYRNRLCFVSLKGVSDLLKWAHHYHYSLQEMKALPKKLTLELDRYFKGRPGHFRYPTVFLSGTDFEKKVWSILKKIPYGQTKSYSWVAMRMRNPKAVRAVGQANRKNAMPIVIPCHRVISSSGGLGGYSGGIGIKKKLLQLEGTL
jgi:methylated-DNA-[protein]-cysteine S-methyltransferase